MSGHRRQVAVAAILVVVLTVGLALELNSPKSGVTTTNTAQGQSSTSSSSSVTSVQKTGATTVGDNASTVATNGLRLSTLINATHLVVGQELNISVSVFNTLAKNNFVPSQNSFYVEGSVTGNWTFYGIPVSTWPDCTGTDAVGEWPQPIEVAVLSGNYTAQQLPRTLNASAAFDCNGGGSGPLFTFEPYSDVINMSGVFSGGAGVQHVGYYPAASNFTVSGYWNASSLSQNDPTVCVPAVPSHCSPPPSVQFIPGVYTIGVSDEWGQFVVLHFQVSNSETG
jgi:hypothetical protein